MLNQDKIHDVTFVFEQSKVFNKYSDFQGSPSQSPNGGLNLSLDKPNILQQVNDLMKSDSFMQEFNGVSVELLRNVTNYNLNNLDAQTLANTLNFAFKYELKSLNALIERLLTAVSELERIDFFSYLIQPLVQHFYSIFSPGLIKAFISNPQGDLTKNDIDPIDIYGSPDIFFRYFSIFSDVFTSSSEIGDVAGVFEGSTEYLKRTILFIYKYYNDTNKASAQDFYNAYINNRRHSNPEVSAALMNTVGASQSEVLRVYYDQVLVQDLGDMVLNYLDSHEDFTLVKILTKAIENNSLKCMVAMIRARSSESDFGQTLNNAFGAAVTSQYVIDVIVHCEKVTGYDFENILQFVSSINVEMNQYPLNKFMYSVTLTTDADIQDFKNFVQRHPNVPIFDNVDVHSLNIKNGNYDYFEAIADSFGEKSISFDNIMEIIKMYLDNPSYVVYLEYLYNRYPDLMVKNYDKIIEALSKMTTIYIDEFKSGPFPQEPESIIDYLVSKGMPIKPEYITLSIENSNPNLFMLLRPTKDNFPQYSVTHITLSQGPDNLHMFLKNIPEGARISTYHLMSYTQKDFGMSRYKKENYLETTGLDKLLDRVFAVVADEVNKAIQSKDLASVKYLFNEWAYEFTKQDLLIAIISGNKDIIEYIKYKITYQNLEGVDTNKLRKFIIDSQNQVFADLYSNLLNSRQRLSGNIKKQFEKDIAEIMTRNDMNTYRLPRPVSPTNDNRGGLLPPRRRRDEPRSLYGTLPLPGSPERRLPGSTQGPMVIGGLNHFELAEPNLNPTPMLPGTLEARPTSSPDVRLPGTLDARPPVSQTNPSNHYKFRLPPR